jgi:hypothetical protein
MTTPANAPLHLLPDGRLIPSLNRRRGIFDHEDLSIIERVYTQIKRAAGTGDNQIMTGIDFLIPVLRTLPPKEANIIRDEWAKDPYTLINQTFSKRIEKEIPQSQGQHKNRTTTLPNRPARVFGQGGGEFFSGTKNQR